MPPVPACPTYVLCTDEVTDSAVFTAANPHSPAVHFDLSQVRYLSEHGVGGIVALIRRGQSVYLTVAPGSQPLRTLSLKGLIANSIDDGTTYKCPVSRRTQHQ